MKNVSLCAVASSIAFLFAAMSLGGDVRLTSVPAKATIYLDGSGTSVKWWRD